MEHFVIIVNGWKALNIITKSSILAAAAVLDPPLLVLWLQFNFESTLNDSDSYLSWILFYMIIRQLNFSREVARLRYALREV